MAVRDASDRNREGVIYELRTILFGFGLSPSALIERPRLLQA